MKIYYVCKYTPLELFRAFDIDCERLDPAPSSFDCADSCAHPNLCGYGKGIIEAIESEDIRALVITDCCDVMRRVYYVLRQQGTFDFLWLLPLPHKSGKADIKTFAAALADLSEAIAKETGRDPDIKTAMAAWEESRRIADEATQDGEYISLTGAHAGSLLMKTIAPRFELPVKDDTCSGNRSLSSPLMRDVNKDNFFEIYAASLLRQEKPCMRMLDRSGNQLAKDAAGVIMHTVKFCDYYSFYYHDVKDSEKPLLKIETDCTPQSSGQIKTRVDAFAETLGCAVKGQSMKNKNIKYAAGIDSGSTSTNAVIMQADGKVLGSSIMPTGSCAADVASKALEAALLQAGIKKDELDAVVTTGYGRETIGTGDEQVTEITCHAKGAHHLLPEARTVIDIGGQDSKVIRIDNDGNVLNFIMNDKCAAGTGRFLDMMAKTLGISLDELGQKGLEWKEDIAISNMCTVFAESEVVSLVAENKKTEDIIHGLDNAVAGKTASLAKRLGGEAEYIMTGGVAQNKGVVKALEEKLAAKVYVPAAAQLCGAIGAALIALGI